MKFHAENVKSYFNSPLFNKNRTKILALVIVIFLIICAAIIIKAYALTQATISVCMTSRPIVKNQKISEGDIIEYGMTKKEFERFARRNNNGVVANTIVTWDQRGSILGTYSAYSKPAGDYYRWTQLTNKYVDNSRLILYANQGKNISELDISNSNIDTYKKFMRVGDKINISCTYDAEYQTNLSLKEISGSIVKKSKVNAEIQTTVTEELFDGIVVADILNSQGESLLDYFTYLDSLPQGQRVEIEKTDEYKKKTQVRNLLVSLTPYQESRFDYYKTKKGVKFNISIPPIDS